MSNSETKPDPKLATETSAASNAKLDLDLEIMRAAGIEDNEILRLADLRHRVAVGDCSEMTAEHKRLVFYRYLLETSRLSDEVEEIEEAA